MALQMESPELGLTLPTNFPNGWQEVDTSVQRKKTILADEVDTSMLKLTTSKLQQTIR